MREHKIFNEEKNEWVPFRELPAYKKRKKFVRDCWVVGGIVLAVIPSVQLAVAGILLGLFCTFSYLDHSNFKPN